jgi:arabinan endo-1,5-alpha-L-arabinosidase
MAKWEYVGDAFTERPSWMDGGIWALDVSKYNRKYYLYYAMSLWGDANPGIGLAVSDSPSGPFEDKGKILTSDEMEAYSIDPMLFVDNGTPYLFFGGITSGIFGIELSKDGSKTVGQKFDIAGTGYEAPYIIKRGKYYYFFGSSGTCCDGADSTYRVSVARSESLKGPYLNQAGKDIHYEDANVILTGYFPPDKDKQRFVGPGHNSIVTDDNGNDWIVYHAVDATYDKLGNGATRRPLMIDELIWKDDWPSVQGLFPSTGEKTGPAFKR